LNQKVVLVTLLAALNLFAFAGAVWWVNKEATKQYRQVTSRPGYHLALLGTIEVVKRTAPASVIASLLPAARPQRVLTDVPPLHLARNYVETDPSRYAHHIESAARTTNVPAALIRAIISAESSFNPYALSATGAVGLMQLMPDTAARYGVKNRLDPSQNIHGGARYLRDLLRMFNNNVRLAVAAYNAGEGAVMKHGRRIPPFPETVAYVPKVLGFYRKYRLA
jgi:soluble lytic murein transglycosylase-like protein